jgi:hypothetical protein
MPRRRAMASRSITLLKALMEIIELTRLFCGEAAWQKFVLLVSENWEHFPDQEELLNAVNGDVDIAKVIAFTAFSYFGHYFISSGLRSMPFECCEFMARLPI